MPAEKSYFLYKTQYPDVLSILNGRNLKPQEFAKNAVFVIDTNALLLPYGLKQESLNEIGRIYKGLLETNRLYVTVHALREFAKNRSPKISELFTEVDKALSAIPSINGLDYPILADLEPYQKLAKFKEDFADFIKPYKDILKELQASINEWNWADPVTVLYSQVFKADNIIDATEDEAKLEEEFEIRMKNGIPPGNKDAGKTVNAIGDFLIWKSVLKLGKDKQLNIALITDDEKNDWMLKGNKKSISTRFELVDEYSRETGGKQFTCMNFANFLRMQGANQEVLSDVTVKAEATSSSDISLKTKNALLFMRSILNDFLQSISPNEENFIANKMLNNAKDDLCNLLLHNYFDQFHNTRAIATRLYDVLQLISKNNYAIEFEFYRAKRSTNQEQEELLTLTRMALQLIEELLNMI